ncbi:MAG: cytochrome c biosis protein CcmG, thiol:disulfide interchange protein DsbE [Thermoleophilaceae bacterium]|jgi:cytochrome c biogenesis protein CcmG/thiol:disulfide interchange protein DsbE|nr:cytochrome c biosis protein CcmG, thiol:disulfide interchange protein DsbE [Thermoleophilaceae bacterium]
MRRALSPVPIAVICVLVALVALLAYGLVQNQPDRAVDEALAHGEREQAPELVLPRLDGSGDASLADYRGKVVVLNFWASWCKPCKDESPLLERWHQRMADRGGLVVGVDMLDLTGRAQSFIDEFGLTYPMLKDKDGKGLEKFGVAQYPETFVIDRQGRIAAVRRGPVDEQFMRKAVEPLLERS